MNKRKYLDGEEQKLIESLEKDNWKPTKNLEGWKTLLSKTVTNTLTKDQRMRLTEKQA